MGVGNHLFGAADEAIKAINLYVSTVVVVNAVYLSLFPDFEGNPKDKVNDTRMLLAWFAATGFIVSSKSRVLGDADDVVP